MLLYVGHCEGMLQRGWRMRLACAKKATESVSVFSRTLRRPRRKVGAQRRRARQAMKIADLQPQVPWQYLQAHEEPAAGKCTRTQRRGSHGSRAFGAATSDSGGRARDERPSEGSGAATSDRRGQAAGRANDHRNGPTPMRRRRTTRPKGRPRAGARRRGAAEEAEHGMLHSLQLSGRRLPPLLAPLSTSQRS